MLGGHLFPSQFELLNPPADGIFTTFQHYKVFLKEMKEICNIASERKARWGTHTCRKTGYVMAIFSTSIPDEQFVISTIKSEMKKVARHLSDHCKTYIEYCIVIVIVIVIYL